MDTTSVNIDSTFLAVDTSKQLLQVTKTIVIEPSCSLSLGVILVIIIFCGLLGGFITFLLDAERFFLKEQDKIVGESNEEKNDVKSPSPKEKIIKLREIIKSRSSHLLLHVLMGIVGAFLIPLFLFFTSSEIFVSCKDGYHPALLLTAYCLVGSIFSRSFLNSMARRLDLEELKQRTETAIKVANQAKVEAVEAKDNVDKSAEKIVDARRIADEVYTIVKDKLELEQLLEENLDENLDKKRIRTMIQEVLDEKQKRSIEFVIPDPKVVITPLNSVQKVWLEMRNPKYTDRSINGIVKRTKLSAEDVKAALLRLKELGYVIEVAWFGKKFYRLSEAGVKSSDEISEFRS